MYAHLNMFLQQCVTCNVPVCVKRYILSDFFLKQQPLISSKQKEDIKTKNNFGDSFKLVKQFQQDSFSSLQAMPSFLF